jgi:hypothetical protein
LSFLSKIEAFKVELLSLCNPFGFREIPPRIFGFGEKNLCFKPFDGFKNLFLGFVGRERNPFE